MSSAVGSRAGALERLQGEVFDLLVVGAGIIGARVALEAARTGAHVALVDAGDFGGATSSASSKLIHGGLRYLQMRDYSLVRESHRERRALIERVAPHLVRPLRFVLPVYRGGPHSVPTVAAGMLTYATLSGFRQAGSRVVGAEGARRLVPALKTEGLLAAGTFEDAQTHDSRLVLATVKAAARAGAVVVNHLAVTGLETAAGRLTTARAGELSIRARAIVNAAGPWVDHVRKLEDARAQPLARLSKGAHVVMELREPWAGAVTTPLPGGRVTFAAPWEGMLLLGTTDTEYAGDPGLVRAEPEDVDTILGEAAIALPPEVLARDRIRYTFAGLRVLPKGEGTTAQASREELIETGRRGMVSVAGGKLTTHRRIALRVLQRIESFRSVRLSSDPLPGGGPLPGRPSDVDEALWAHLAHLYGSETLEVLAGGGEGTPVHPGGPDVWAQVVYAADQEWALTVDDVVRRRTTIAIRGLATSEVREAVAATLASRGVLEGSDGS